MLVLLSPFHTKARQMIKGRKGVWQKVVQADRKAAYLWVHCASLGEFEQGRPLIERYKAQNPENKVLLTFFSPSGYEIRQNYDGADVIIYLPFDTPKNARRLLDAFTISTAIFVKYEFWHFYLKALKKRHIPTYSISSVFRKKQAFFRWYGAWYRKTLSCFTTFFVQNESSQILLTDIGITNVKVVGDTRFDRVADIVKQAHDLPEIAHFKNGKTLLVAGSTWPKDEQLLIPFINADNTPTKYIIAAHEVHEAHIASICAQLTVPYQRYTQLDRERFSSVKVLVIDTIGILSSAYRYGEIAYIGGGFGVGIHNILEAATYGLPVVFGPHYQKFREAVDLLEKKAAFPIHHQAELTDCLSVFLKNRAFLEKTSEVASKYVQSNTGATDLILSEI